MGKLSCNLLVLSLRFQTKQVGEIHCQDKKNTILRNERLVDHFVQGKLGENLVKIQMFSVKEKLLFQQLFATSDSTFGLNLVRLHVYHMHY